MISGISLQDEGTTRVFVAGIHEFLFSIVVPASTAPYENSEHGSITHRLVVSASFEREGVFSTSSSLGAEAPILLLVNPAPIGDTHEFNLRKDGEMSELGAYVLTASSSHLTVGGLLSVGYYLTEVPNVHPSSQHMLDHWPRCMITNARSTGDHEYLKSPRLTNTIPKLSQSSVATASGQYCAEVIVGHMRSASTPDRPRLEIHERKDK